MPHRRTHFAVCTAIAVLFIATTAAVAAEPFCVLSSADTMEKVFRDEPTARGPTALLTIEAARNEVEGVQLIVAPAGKDDLRGATLNITDLQTPDGGRIAAANIAWHVVGYVQTEKPAYKTPKIGWWPDPLLPGTGFDVKTGQVQPLWIDVRVPAEAKAGQYRGAVSVCLADGRRQSVPLE